MVAPTFSKKERIVSNKLMETLFEKGDSQVVTAFPLKAVYLSIDKPATGRCSCPGAYQCSQETIQARC